MRLLVARIGMAHGLKGEVALDLRSDTPETRLIPGATFQTEGGGVGQLTVAKVRELNGRWFVTFAEIGDRTTAEDARGTELVIDAEASDEEGAWFVHELVGLKAVRPDGTEVGEVVDLLDMPAHDVLVVREPSGHRAMIPFIEAFVPEVDVAVGRVIVTPPFGLLEGEDVE